MVWIHRFIRPRYFRRFRLRGRFRFGQRRRPPSKPIDLATFSRWQLLNANDNASQTNRTIVEVEVLGSGDGKTWWRLAVSNNANATNTNYAVVHSGSLVPRKGDLWSDLDLADRDWANGIAVDGV